MGKEIVSRTTFIKGVTACVVVAASLGILTIGEYSINSSEKASTATSAAVGTASYTAGTYTASSAGISSDVTVTCTFDESSITAITVDVSGETAGIGADIGDEMIANFLAAQSSDVDGVSGATITSDALKSALEDCIAQATGDTDGEDTGAEAETESEAETEDASEAENETEAGTEDAEAETEDVETEAVETEAAETEAAETEAAETEAAETEAVETEVAETEATDTEEGTSTASSGSTYTPGVYSASAAGIDSDVTVTISVDEESILSVGCDVSGETAGIGAEIGTEISAQILTAQSADVDGVSGATVTSDAVKAAAADALAQAMGGTAASEAAETETAETEAVETETEIVETEAAQTDAAETEAVETEVAEAETAETEDMETEAAETEAAETEAAETETAETEAASAKEADAADGTALYTPGTYTATAEGIDSTITVSVSFDETSMYRIDYDLSGETAGLGADIGPEITAQILEAQSVDVDGVSGATVTSDAVKQAVEDCIAQALTGDADSDDTATIIGGADTSTEIYITDNDSDESDAENESETEAETDVDEETDAEEESRADESGAAAYVSGTYTSTSEGYSTEVTVTMTFDESSIIEMDADVSGETSTWALIDDDVIAQVLEAQSADVDGVSGATVTADAILEAAEDCIAQALTGEADSEGASAVIDEAAAEDTAEAESDAEEESGAAVYVPGTYTATAEGIDSTVTVSVSFDETRMYRIDYDLSGETAGLGADIGPEITAQILEAQSVDVDGVSGATVTSDAVRQAVEDCIGQAQVSQN